MQSETVITPKVEKYPNKPITLIVPFGPGAGLDLVARILEKNAPKYLGQPLIVINKPGGAGTTGWNQLVTSNPDGYTIGMTGIEILLHPLYGISKYNYPTDLEPLIQISDLPIVMAVRADQPWKTTNDLIEYAKKHPGQVKFAHAGAGTIGHVSGETFAKAADIVLAQVPFQSSSEAMASLLGNHVQAVFINPASVKEQIKSGSVRALAITSTQRLNDPLLADVPTFKEQGLDVAFSNWYGVAVPKEIPADIKSKLVKGLNAMINEPEFKKQMESLGLQINYLDSKESEEKWLTDSEKLSKIVQETGIADLINSERQ
ncbi:tripartite tricarboxylate transporter substrate binding protein [Pelorhabdus rhamnosifermentans]|uniref:tripartite tricarboxylate transporter substrate binding protein n=1 Tax=Pelorhabdus rhamnosifermentans TaxID=2772457 RepID=UPI001C0628D2|nr:tripartite tricarboxylate transporter substrate binding protein [Pelorhabdus rhamnosifermentans]